MTKLEPVADQQFQAGDLLIIERGFYSDKQWKVRRA
jgi:hypothetical protein